MHHACDWFNSFISQGQDVIHKGGTHSSSFTHIPSRFTTTSPVLLGCISQHMTQITRKKDSCRALKSTMTPSATTPEVVSHFLS